jgi:hypothetical protein
VGRARSKRHGEQGALNPTHRRRAPAGTRLRRPVWAASVAAAFLAGAAIGPVAAQPRSPAPGGHAARSASVARFAHLDHVFVIMMENTSYKDLLSASNSYTGYIRRLAGTDGLATDYYGVTHTSLPNYVAATSGRTWGSHSDDDAQAAYLDHENVVDELEAAHVTWKAYMQSLPYAGDTTDTASGGLYVRKHDPFLLYPDVYDNPGRARQVVPLAQLRTDLAGGHVPQFAWISPNVCDDMHGGAPQCPYASPANPSYQNDLYRDGDQFLRKWVGLITSSRAWTGHSAIFVTWDEGSYADVSPYGPLDDRGCCDSPRVAASSSTPADETDLADSSVYGGGHIPMIVVQDHGLGHVSESAPANHYSLLRTIEENWGLPLLGNAGDSVQVRSLSPLLVPAGAPKP